MRESSPARRANTRAPPRPGRAGQKKARSTPRSGARSGERGCRDANACRDSGGRRRQDRTAYSSAGALDPLDVGGVQPLLTAPDLELDLLPFAEPLEAVHRDCGEMHEDVLTALLFNEAVALGVIEPFHFASGHSSCLLRGETDPALRCAGQAYGGLRAPI